MSKNMRKNLVRVIQGRMFFPKWRRNERLIKRSIVVTVYGQIDRNVSQADKMGHLTKKITGEMK